ncbi:MAG: hypothetical protein HKO98_09880, partial [Gemmatimonadetes bacterium]|nr:hypothetical protein [Gemmatimonadota bacterium]
MRATRGLGIAVAATVAGLFLTPKLMPGHALAHTVERFVDRTVDAVVGAVDRTVDRSRDGRAERSADRAADRAERGGQSASQEPFRWAGALDAGQVIEIRGVNGPVEAVRASGDRIVVEADKTARRSDPAEVVIEAVEHGDGVTF